MNYSRIALAGLGALVVYFALGFLLLAVLPVADELRQYAAVYRAPESMNRVAPVGMVALLVAMMALAALYSLAYRDGPAFASALLSACAGTGRDRTPLPHTGQCR